MRKPNDLDEILTDTYTWKDQPLKVIFYHDGTIEFIELSNDASGAVINLPHLLQLIEEYRWRMRFDVDHGKPATLQDYPNHNGICPVLHMKCEHQLCPEFGCREREIQERVKQ